MSRRSYIQANWDNVKKRAANEFKNHRVTAEGDGRWYFGAPGTGVLHMRVISAPRMIMSYGDLGPLIMIPSDDNAFRWLSSCLANHGSYDPCYIAEKVPNDLCITDFNQERVLETIQEMRKRGDEYEEDSHRQKMYFEMVKELEDHREFESAAHFAETCWQAGNRRGIHFDDGTPSVEGLTWQFFFQLEAFRYFFMRVNEAL